MNNNYNFIIILLLLLVISFFSTKIEKAYPEALHEYLDEPLFKLLALLVVTYVSNYNFTIGLLLAVVVVFSVTDVSLMSEMSERFINGPALTECGAYDKNHINFTQPYHIIKLIYQILES